MTTKNPEVLDPETSTMDVAADMSSLALMTRGEIDVQISTAKRYPRSLKTFKDKALAMATLDEETAESCMYALPRGGKTIDGPSARMAEVLQSAYGNMRIAGSIVDVADKVVVARGICWDLENNVAKSVEVRRRITKKDGKRFDDDMITVASNAAISIATRNVVLQIIPQSFWRPIYLACRQIVAGDAKTLSARREAMIDHFMKMGVLPDKVFASIDVRGVEDITLDHLVTLKGVASAIKNGETSIDNAFDMDGAVTSQAAGDPVDGYLAQLPADEQAAIRTLLATAKLNKGQTAALLKKHENNPKGLVAELQGLTAPAKPTDQVKTAPSVASAASETATPSAADVFKGSAPKPAAVKKASDDSF